MYVIFTDESILARPHKDEVEEAIWYIQNAKRNITIEEDLQYLLGINIDSKHDGSIHIMQPHLIDQILEYIKMGETVKLKSTPASSYRLLLWRTAFHDFEN